MFFEGMIECAGVHVLHKNGDITVGLVEDAMNADDVGRVGGGDHTAEDFFLPGELTEVGGVGLGGD